ncbi:hypothetical protein AJ79_08718 [Helicocarpus griseus UAMH5409]|uniref:Mediator of RNA polymerase II transcription subunit 17 n=1 Tax=Helicocarpus griseus UAMH5409 TaxID=1447875 RepID=A0A2B7WR16_9EURO|nr:hypothetical protein AJ79_08718 [Helicocarpus griseus UAMH5409]
MAESFSLPLRAVGQKATEPDPLPIRIAQINAQRGSFRNVTEQSLQEEIDAQRAAGVDAQEVAEAESEEVKPSDRLEQLFKSRAEIVEFAMQAHAEANYALDFVSLLVSKHTPRQAEISMSPYLKQRAPLGSLGIDIVKIPEKTEAVIKDIDDLSRGWKLENFDAAANKLLQSASRLEETVAAETKYWAEVLDIKDKGWKICRLPRERQTLGVQFGFMEATPTFRDRGLAALRRGNEGDLLLDRGLNTSSPRSLRVRVQQDDEIVGVSNLIRLEVGPDESFESRIRLARDALYEEELFHEINREARSLLHHGIESKQNLIQFQASDSQQILVDLVGLEDGVIDLEQQGHAEDALAETVAQSLRILLSHAHRQKYRRRTQIPPPVTAKRRPNPEYSLLQPAVCYLQHKSALQWLESFLDSITKTLQLAGLNCKYNIAPMVSINLPQISTTASSDPDAPPFIEKLVGTFVSPLESVTTGTFPSPTSTFKIRLTTTITPQTFGTEFELATNTPSIPRSNSISKPTRIGLRDDLKQLLLHLFTTDLVFLVPHLAGGTGLSSSHYFSRADMNQDEEDDFSDEIPASKPHHLTPWIPTSPENGELTAFAHALRRSKRLAVDLQVNRLAVRCQWLGGLDAPTGTEGDAENADGRAKEKESDKAESQGIIEYSWYADGTRQGADTIMRDGEKSLKEVLQIMSGDEEKGAI